MFCYKAMSFVLKNAGATYQRAMLALFHDMMHKEIEVYVDDMIAKSRTKEEHLVNLWKLFERLHKYQLRLNPTKCTAMSLRRRTLLKVIVLGDSGYVLSIFPATPPFSKPEKSDSFIAIARVGKTSLMNQYPHAARVALSHRFSDSLWFIIMIYYNYISASV